MPRNLSTTPSLKTRNKGKHSNSTSLLQLESMADPNCLCGLLKHQASKFMDILVEQKAKGLCSSNLAAQRKENKNRKRKKKKGKVSKKIKETIGRKM